MCFAQTNVPKLFNLKKELAYLSQGNMSISAYFTKFRTLNDELDELADVPRCNCDKCTCDNNVKIEKYLNDVKLSQFLMGLSEQFTAVRSHLLLVTPTPTLSAAYSVLLQEENQRDCKFSTVTDSVAMSVKSQNSQKTNFSTKTNKTNNKSSEAVLYCDFCQMSGHIKEKCFCIHEFPEWNRMYGKPKPKPRTRKGSFNSSNSRTAHAYSVSNESAGAAQSNSNSPMDNVSSEDTKDGFSNSQYKQLMAMIQNGFKEMSSHTHQASSANVWSATSSMPAAGTLMHFVSHATHSLPFTSDMWILDSGATDHITPHFNLLTNPRLVNTSLHLPNGQMTSVTHVGNITLHNSIVLTDVLFVPTCNYNLISIPKLTQTTNCEVIFTKDSCTLLQNPVSENVSLTKNCNSTVVSSSKLWHARLGYPSVSSMKLLPLNIYDTSMKLMIVTLVIWLNSIGCHFLKVSL